MGTTCDSAVLAACLSSQDIFTAPSPLILRNPADYSEAVQRSSKSRCLFDAGHYSEPIMLRNAFVQWLTDLDQGHLAPYGQRPNIKARLLQSCREFSRYHAVVAKRLVQVSVTLLDICTRLQKLLPDNRASSQLGELISVLSNTRNPRQGKDIQQLFTKDMLLLKAVLCASFAPQFILGTPKVSCDEYVQSLEPVVAVAGKGKRKGKAASKKKHHKVLDLMIKFQLDPRRTLILSGIPQKFRRSPELLKQSMTLMCYGLDFHIQIPPEMGNLAFISFPDSPINRTLEGPRGKSALHASRSMPQIVDTSDTNYHSVRVAPPSIRIEKPTGGLRRNSTSHPNFLSVENNFSSSTLCGRLDGIQKHENHRLALLQSTRLYPHVVVQQTPDFADLPFAAHVLARFGRGCWRFKAPVPPAACAPNVLKHNTSVLSLRDLSKDDQNASSSMPLMNTSEGVTYGDPDSPGVLSSWDFYSSSLDILKPSTVFLLSWNLLMQPDAAIDASSMGNKKTPKNVKGVTNFRNSVGFVSDCPLSDAKQWADIPLPYRQPHPLFGVYVAMQGTDTSNMCWLEGVTVLPSHLACSMMVSLLRHHYPVDFQISYSVLEAPEIISIRLFGGQYEWFKGTSATEEPLLSFSVLEQCNVLRSKLSECLKLPKVTSNRRYDEKRVDLDVCPDVQQDFLDLLRNPRRQSNRMEEEDLVRLQTSWQGGKGALLLEYGAMREGGKGGKERKKLANVLAAYKPKSVWINAFTSKRKQDDFEFLELFNLEGIAATVRAYRQQALQLIEAYEEDRHRGAKILANKSKQKKGNNYWSTGGKEIPPVDQLPMPYSRYPPYAHPQGGRGYRRGGWDENDRVGRTAPFYSERDRHIQEVIAGINRQQEQRGLPAYSFHPQQPPFQNTLTGRTSNFPPPTQYASAPLVFSPYHDPAVLDVQQ